MNTLVKVLKQFVHWFVVFVILCISFWVAGQRESKDGFRYFVTALVVSIILSAVYGTLVYLLPLARRKGAGGD